MSSGIRTALVLLAGISIGAVAVQTLHAQTKAPVYYVNEIEITNLDGYMAEYAPKAQAMIKSSGGKFLASSNKAVTIQGDPPKTRVTIQVWDSIDKINAWRNSAEYKEARKIGDKYAKFRAWAVEGLAQ